MKDYGMIYEELMVLYKRILAYDRGAQDEIYVEEIDGFDEIRVGICRNGVAVVLPAAEGSSEPISTDFLNVAFSLRCSIATSNSAESSFQKICLVELKTREDSKVEVFFSIISLLLIRAQYLEKFDIKKFISELVELFSIGTLDSDQDIDGVFGELVFIFVSINPAQSIAAWRNSSGDRYDFSFGAKSVEVKTSLGVRKHNFSMSQLSPVVGIDCYVASIQAQVDSSGTSVSELVNLILRRIGSLGDGFEKKFARNIGKSWRLATEKKYDLVSTFKSLRIYSLDSIPKILDYDDGVSEIRFVSDLQSIASVDLSGVSGCDEFLIGLLVDDIGAEGCLDVSPEAFG